MLIIHDFGIDIQDYVSNGKDNNFPMIFECLFCSAKGLLHRHGFYKRNGIVEGEELVVVICRLICTCCKKTFSIIPDFLIPYYQHTLDTIVAGIDQSLAPTQSKVKMSRQLLSYYKKKFLSFLTWIHSFFADLGQVFGMSAEKKNQACGYLERIRNFGESSFLRKSFGHMSTYFMSNLIQ